MGCRDGAGLSNFLLDLWNENLEQSVVQKLLQVFLGRCICFELAFLQKEFTYPFLSVVINAPPVVTCCNLVNGPVLSKMAASNPIIMTGFQYSCLGYSVSDNLTWRINRHCYPVHYHQVTSLPCILTPMTVKIINTYLPKSLLATLHTLLVM